jgi:hypothetical protein
MESRESRGIFEKSEGNDWVTSQSKVRKKGEKVYECSAILIHDPSPSKGNI